MFLSLLRIIKFSFQDIGRNIWLSLVTITILCLALFSINSLLTVQVISQTAIEAVKQKVDVSLYLTPQAPESKIMELKSQIQDMEGVKQVSYTSKQEALQTFKSNNKDNPEILKALRELGKNPLSPSLVISPENSNQASQIITNLKRLESDIIASRDFSDNSLMLSKINNITDKVNEVGLFIISIFVITSLLVVYNAIRVAIYTHRAEIGIMRLVGASNAYIYMPFIVSSIIYTLLSLLIVIALFFPFLSILQPYLEVFFKDYNVNILSYFLDNFWQIFGAQFLVVCFINALASLIAVKKYSKV